MHGHHLRREVEHNAETRYFEAGQEKLMLF